MKPSNKWNELTMQQKADLMKLYVANGYTNLDSIKNDYNGTPYASSNSSDYDYYHANEDNMPKEKGEHYSSRNPRTGEILKSESHPTRYLTDRGEAQAGMTMYKNKINGRTFTTESDLGDLYGYEKVPIKSYVDNPEELALRLKWAESKHHNTFNEGGPAETQPEEKSGWKKAKEVAYDVLEFVDPTGISSYATSEGDLRQAIEGYKKGTASLGDVGIEAVGALPLIGKVGKGIRLAKGISKLDYFIKAIDKANDIAKRIDTIQEVIPGVKKVATAVQGATGAVTNHLANIFNLSADSRRYINYGIDVFNNSNTTKDIVDIFKSNPYDYPISGSNYVEKQPEKSTKYITNDNYLDEHAKFRLAFEEYYPKAYYDSLGKKYTVGTGLTYIIDKNGKEIPVKKGDTITEEENLRQLQMREQRAEEYARSKTKYWDLYHPELKFQILDAMFNVGNHGVWNKSPKYQSALREYEKEEGWKNPNYDLTKIFKHADWNLNNENWLGIRARMRQNPQAINPEDYGLIYNNNHIDSLRTVYTLR